MKILVFGLGYVGFTAACCLSKQGHQVIGIDVSQDKVDEINRGQPPFEEPVIPQMLTEAISAGRLTAQVSIDTALEDADLAIVCVGTPSSHDGAHNMSFIASVTQQIASALHASTRRTPLTITYRSTMRPGTTDELINPIFISHLGEHFDKKAEIVYNPEFLRESMAVQDFFNPPKIVIGTKDGAPSHIMEALNDGMTAPVFYTGYREAEITKFVDNSWHAVKVTFANEIGRICRKLEISSEVVHQIFKSDTKLNISPYYTRPGGPFGGSCLPKDVRALEYIASEVGASATLISSLIISNEAHKNFHADEIKSILRGNDRVLMVGLAFKTGTDDLRESPNIDLARKLLLSGVSLSIFDSNLDLSKIRGQNLGHAYAHLPTIDRLLVDKACAEATDWDIVINSNGDLGDLTFANTPKVVNVHTLK